MKKLLLVLGMITCILGLTACGKEAVLMDIVEADAAVYGEQLVDNINLTVLDGMEAQYEDDIVISKALASYKTALEVIGDYESIKETSVTVERDTTKIEVTVIGTEKEAIVEIIIDDEYMLVSASTNVSYTFGEKMSKASLDTVIGMGSVFGVLILICLIISSFKIIAKIEAKSKKTKEIVIDNPITQIIEKEEVELADDLELVAVISAAIAASQEQTTTAGFVVRSIKRANQNKWQKA